MELELDVTRPIELDITVQAPAVDITVTPGEAVAIIAVPGERGPQGVPGVTEFTGAAWFYGHGAPGTIVGSKVDDQYMDLDTGSIYTLGG